MFATTPELATVRRWRALVVLLHSDLVVDFSSRRNAVRAACAESKFLYQNPVVYTGASLPVFAAFRPVSLRHVPILLA